MATANEIREWGRANGYDPGVKGAIGRALRDAYDAAHPSGNGAAPAGPDYPAGMDEGLFETAAADEPPGELELGDTGEIAPRPPARGSRSIRGGLRSRLNRGSAGKPGPAGRKKKAAPRVPVDDLIGAAWRIAAKLARPMPPLYRVLRLQSPVAGLLLEDTVKGTVVDTVLQPLARMAGAGEAVSALMLPPAAVAAYMSEVTRAAAADRPPNPVVLQACEEALRHGLMAMMHISGDKMAAVIARERDQEQRYGASVDDLMGMIFAPPGDDAAEDQALSDAARRMAGQTIGG